MTSALDSDWGHDATLATFCDEEDERLALAVGLECGWSGRVYRDLPLCSARLNAVATEYPYYLGGLYAARIGRVVVPILKTSLAAVCPPVTVPIFWHPSQVHAFIVGVDAGTTGLEYQEMGLSPELHGEVEDFVLYYHAGRFVSSIASWVVPLVRLIPGRVVCRLGSR